jgi:hypothetical protein
MRGARETKRKRGEPKIVNLRLLLEEHIPCSPLPPNRIREFPTVVNVWYPRAEGVAPFALSNSHCNVSESFPKSNFDSSLKRKFILNDVSFKLTQHVHKRSAHIRKHTKRELY